MLFIQLYKKKNNVVSFFKKSLNFFELMCLFD